MHARVWYDVNSTIHAACTGEAKTLAGKAAEGAKQAAQKVGGAVKKAVEDPKGTAEEAAQGAKEAGKKVGGAVQQTVEYPKGSVEEAAQQAREVAARLDAELRAELAQGSHAGDDEDKPEQAPEGAYLVVHPHGLLEAKVSAASWLLPPRVHCVMHEWAISRVCSCAEQTPVVWLCTRAALAPSCVRKGSFGNNTAR